MSEDYGQILRALGIAYKFGSSTIPDDELKGLEKEVSALCSKGLLQRIQDSGYEITDDGSKKYESIIRYFELIFLN